MAEGDWFADVFVESGMDVLPEPAGAVAVATPPAAEPVTPEAAASPAVVESGTAAVDAPEAETLTPEARIQQLEAQLAETSGKLTSKEQAELARAAQEAAQKAAAEAARQRALEVEQIRREVAVAKTVHARLTEDGETELARQFAQAFDAMGHRMQAARAGVEERDDAINAFVYTLKVLADQSLFADVIEVADSVAKLKGDEMFAAVDALLESRRTAREAPLLSQKRILELEAEIEKLKTQTTDPAAHIVDGAPSTWAQKPENEWTIEDHIAYAQRGTVGSAPNSR